MKLTVINGTNREGNRSMSISTEIAKRVDGTYIVTLDNFTELFRGDHINWDNANEAQKKDLLAILDANVLIFVVPTYHHGMSGSLKNFFDLLDIPELFSHNVIGIISANKGGRDGARQTAQVINGYIAYYKAENSYIMPDMPVLNPSLIDEERLQKFIDTLEKQSK